MDDGLAHDLVAMWQSELTAMAADRELRESWAALLALWAGAATAAMSALRPHEFSSRNAGAAEPSRPSPATAASHPGMDEIERLGRRVRELEQRVAELDQPDHRPQHQSQPEHPPGPEKRPRRRPRSAPASTPRNGNA